MKKNFYYRIINIAEELYVMDKTTMDEYINKINYAELYNLYTEQHKLLITIEDFINYFQLDSKFFNKVESRLMFLVVEIFENFMKRIFYFDKIKGKSKKDLPLDLVCPQNEINNNILLII